VRLVTPTMPQRRRIDFLGVPLDLLSMSDTVVLVQDAMRTKKRLQHVVVNVAKFVNMRENEELRRDIIESDVINIDGMGIVLGCRLLGVRGVERVAGIDLMKEVLQLCAFEGFRPYFLGATQEVLEKAVATIKLKFPTLSIAGYRNGYYKPDEQEGIASSIRTSGADCLFVAISSPIKERFIRAHRDALGVSFIMGVGGALDVVAGVTKRAPPWMQQAGLEWLYRVIQEPRRLWKRYLITNVRFAMILARALLAKRRGE
jgi:N-acetylglucosaminyldiphosphoundecaprenol N-acetyl-beta-D-mannosaminyltransferase